MATVRELESMVAESCAAIDEMRRLSGNRWSPEDDAVIDAHNQLRAMLQIARVRETATRAIAALHRIHDERRVVELEAAMRAADECGDVDQSLALLTEHGEVLARLGR